MKCVFAAFILLLLPGSLLSQVTPAETENGEQQLEQFTEAAGDAESEDDSRLMKLDDLRRRPLNLADASVADMMETGLFTDLQARSLETYRLFAGPLVDVYELQAVPGWTPAFIRQVKPFVFVGQSKPSLSGLRDEFMNGHHSLLFRWSRRLEKQDGYLRKSDSTAPMYLGSPDRFFLRHRFNSGRSLQFGFVAEKDPGEPFFRSVNRQGFDFYSGFASFSMKGVLRELILGDFIVNMGQGLVSWQGLAFGKGPDLSALKRQSPLFRPYNSAGESLFRRGIAVVLSRKSWELGVFLSHKKLDANRAGEDSLTGVFASSIMRSGLHRTTNEISDRSVLSESAAGARIQKKLASGHVSVQGTVNRYSLPMRRQGAPYRALFQSGDRFGHGSLDFSFTIRNLHLFGEAAYTGSRSAALITGALLSLSPNTDAGLLIRSISPAYETGYGSAFLESSAVTNENGMFMGTSIRISGQWQLDAYADFFQFPWLRYRVSAPAGGADYFFQLTWRPSRKTEFTGRYRSKTTEVNGQSGAGRVAWPEPVRKRTWRVHLNQQLNGSFVLRTRLDWVQVSNLAPAVSDGSLAYVELVYKPMMKKLSGSLRWQFFQTDDYDSRLYAFENDVLFARSVPVFSGTGKRFYININYNINKRLECWWRLSRTVYGAVSSLGSGGERVSGNSRTEVKWQLLYDF